VCPSPNQCQSATNHFTTCVNHEKKPPGAGGLGNGGGVGVADGANTLPPLLCLAAIVTEVPRTLTERSTTVIATTLANRFVFIFFSTPLSIQYATLRLLPFGSGLAQRNVDCGYKPACSRGAAFDPAEESPEIDTIRLNFRPQKSQPPMLVHLSIFL